MLARRYCDPSETEEFTTTPTSDLLVVMVTSGRYVIQSRQRRLWHRDEYRPGSVGITAPGHGSTLRWRSLTSQPLTSLHLFLSSRLVESTLREFRQSGTRVRAMPDALSVQDPLVESVGRAVLRAVEHRAPALYADSLAQTLVAHLLLLAERGSFTASPPRPGRTGGLDEGALRRITDYMHEHLHEDIMLDQLAAEVHISKYHLLRRFTTTTGLTPYRYLTGLRLAKAARMLLTTASSVLEIGQACGYRSSSRFAATFRRRYGMAPAEYRRHMRR
jgi:AraC family transcriptional regulator